MGTKGTKKSTEPSPKAIKTATKIVETLKKHTAPGSSTWGDKHPEAHEELFGKGRAGYFDDLVHDIASELD